MKRAKIIGRTFTSGTFKEVDYHVRGCFIYGNPKQIGNKDILGCEVTVISTIDGSILFKDSKGLFRTSVTGSYEFIKEWHPRRGDEVLASDDDENWEKVKFLETFPEAVKFTHCCIHPTNEGVSDYAFIKECEEPIVLFVNCVGEVFTEENIQDKVYWLTGVTLQAEVLSKLDHTLLKSSSKATDIFKSKKSLLNYLASKEE